MAWLLARPLLFLLVVGVVKDLKYLGDIARIHMDPNRLGLLLKWRCLWGHLLKACPYQDMHGLIKRNPTATC